MEDRFSFIKNNIGIYILFTAFLLALIFLHLCLSVRGGVSADKYKRLDSILVEVKHEDGTQDSYNSNMFRYRSKKDKITMHIPLDESLKREYQSVNFFFYGSVVKAYYKDRLLASYGENVKRHMIGHLKIFVPVPMEAYGDEIRVEIEPSLNFLEDHFEYPVLMSMEDALFFPILGNESAFAFFYMVAVGSTFAIVIFGFLYFVVDYAKEGFWLSNLIFAITVWYMGNSGMFYAVCAGEDVNAVVEYIGMYMLFFSAPLYSSYETSRPWVKRALHYGGKFFFVVFLLTVILFILPTGYNYVWNLRIAQFIQFVVLFSSMMSNIFRGKQNNQISDHIMSCGMILVCASGMLEQSRIILSASITEKWPLLFQWYSAAPFGRYLIYLLVVTFVFSYIFKVGAIVRRSLEEKHLRVLAYTDPLTDIGNRQYLQRKLDLLDSNHKTDYAVIFMDINDLKYTNDIFGHDSGDRLIRMLADAIREAVEYEDGFSGRNGGDEFLSVVIPAREVENVANRILENLALAKEKQKPSFPVSVSMGIAKYREVAEELYEQGIDPVTSSHVIRMADERMYEAKRQYRKNRKNMKKQ